MPVPPINPWSTLTWSGNKSYASIDSQFLTDYDNYCKSKSKTNDLRLGCLPEPFVGDPDANVYLLNGNPGYNKVELKFAKDPIYRNLVQNSLNHNIALIKSRGFDPFIYFNNLALSTNPSIIHSGCDWWQKRTKKFCNAIKTANKQPNIFNIEFFPYHSRNLKQIRAYLSSNPLPPSAAYVDNLIFQAMDAKKPIVVLRMQQMWFYRISGLQKYPNLYVLKNPRCLYITPANVCAGPNTLVINTPFDDLVSKC